MWDVDGSSMVPLPNMVAVSRDRMSVLLLSERFERYIHKIKSCCLESMRDEAAIGPALRYGIYRGRQSGTCHNGRQS
jgi:hypothetical protein